MTDLLRPSLPAPDLTAVSAGRVPTQLGLRLFVDGLMEVGSVAEADRSRIESQLGQGGDVNAVLDRVGAALSVFWPAAIAVYAAGPSLPILYPVMAMSGAGIGLFSVLWETALAQRIPPHVLSRVSAWDWMGSLALLPSRRTRAVMPVASASSCI